MPAPKTTPISKYARMPMKNFISAHANRRLCAAQACGFAFEIRRSAARPGPQQLRHGESARISAANLRFGHAAARDGPRSAGADQVVDSPEHMLKNMDLLRN